MRGAPFFYMEQGVYGAYRIINTLINQEYYRFNAQTQDKITFDKLLRRNFIGTISNPLIKKECVEEVGGFDEELQSNQDYDLWLRIVARYPAAYIDKPLLNYYIHEGERISPNVDSKIAGLEYLNLKYHEYLEKDNLAWYLRHRHLLWFYLKKIREKPCGFTLGKVRKKGALVSHSKYERFLYDCFGG